VQFPNESITKLLIDAILSLTSVIANACDHHDNDNLRSVDEDTDHHAETSQDRRQLKEIPKKFVMDGIEFPSQEASIKSGARCGTKDRTEEEREKEKNDIAVYRAKYPNDSRSIEIITIPVVFNVIFSFFGGGRLSRVDVEAQMDVFNSAFTSSGFSFNLRNVQYHRNSRWFRRCFLIKVSRIPFEAVLQMTSMSFISTPVIQLVLFMGTPPSLLRLVLPRLLKGTV
jgi:hypothetical protein